MKSVSSIYVAEPALARVRWADYLELTKPRVAVLVLFTVAAGAILAERGIPNLLVLLHTLFGTALVAAGASMLNQYLERHLDGLMPRTENRPLPSGRVQPVEALVLGTGFGIIGVAYLTIMLEHPWAAVLAGMTFVLYILIYTPLKQVTSWNTVIGALPGALPPIIGWAAVRGPLNAEALALFLILFFWQLPHFFAIAWIYRTDYAGAGYRMISTVDKTGQATARGMIGYCVILLLVSLTPVFLKMVGAVYLFGALTLGSWFLFHTIRFALRKSETRARDVLRASLVYLPVVFGLLILDSLLLK